MVQQQHFVHPQALVETESIGDGTRIWAFAHVQRDVVIGENCNIGDHAFVETGVKIGNNVTIKNGVCVWQHVHLADNVFLGPNVVLTNDLNPRSRKADWTPVETFIEEGVTVGANATIVCGITIGTRAFIGAGAVVTRDVRPYELVYGNPARSQGWVCYCGRPLKPNSRQLTECEACQRKYRVETNKGIQEIS